MKAPVHVGYANEGYAETVSYTLIFMRGTTTFILQVVEKKKNLIKLQCILAPMYI